MEDGLSFVENAIIKARHASVLTGLPAIADWTTRHFDFTGYVTGFPPAESSPGDLAGALEEVSLEDALSAPAEEPRAFAPAPAMPLPEEPQPLDILTEAAPAADPMQGRPARTTP